MNSALSIGASTGTVHMIQIFSFIYTIFFWFVFFLSIQTRFSYFFNFYKLECYWLYFLVGTFFSSIYLCCLVMILKLENDTAKNALRWQMLTIWFEPNAKRKKKQISRLRLQYFFFHRSHRKIFSLRHEMALN